MTENARGAEGGGTMNWWRRRRFALAVALASAVGAFALSLTLPWLLWGQHHWWVGPDTWWTVQSARWLGGGGVATVYQANPWYAALPGFLVVLAPFARLGADLGLVSGNPAPVFANQSYAVVAHPSMWLLIGPVFAVCGALAVPGIDALAESLDVASGVRRVVAVAVGVLVVIPTVTIAAHPEDLLALACVCAALAQLRNGRPERGALLMMVAILFQTWAGLVLPLFIVLAPPLSRLRALVLASAAPAAVGAFYLLTDPHAAVSILGQPMPNRGQFLPWWKVAPHLTVSQAGQSVSLVSGSSTRILAVVVAVGVAVLVAGRGGRAASGVFITVAPAAVMLARGLCETEIWPYYLAPAAVFLTLAAATQSDVRRRAVIATCAAAVGLNAPLAYVGWSSPPWMWLFMTSAAGAVGLAVSAWPLDRPAPWVRRTDPVSAPVRALSG